MIPCGTLIRHETLSIISPAPESISEGETGCMVKGILIASETRLPLVFFLFHVPVKVHVTVQFDAASNGNIYNNIFLRTVGI
jgi:hypothetical protein